MRHIQIFIVASRTLYALYNIQSNICNNCIMCRTSISQYCCAYLIVPVNKLFIIFIKAVGWSWWVPPLLAPLSPIRSPIENGRFDWKFPNPYIRLQKSDRIFFQKNIYPPDMFHGRISWGIKSNDLVVVSDTSTFLIIMTTS